MNISAHSGVNLKDSDSSALVRAKPLWFEMLWQFLGLPVLRSSMLPFSSLKAGILRAFGAKVGKGVYIKPGVRVKFPWKLIIGEYSWIGEDAWIDNLASVTIGSHCCISQAAYLCTGNHDWSSTTMNLFTGEIHIEDGAWVGARAVIGPGTSIGSCAIVALGSVVTQNTPAYEIHAGNPAHFVKRRAFRLT